MGVSMEGTEAQGYRVIHCVLQRGVILGRAIPRLLLRLREGRQRHQM